MLISTIEYFITSYGYLAIFVFTLLEGETVMILAGLAAHHGYLSLEWVIFWGFVGAFFDAQLLFWIGRRYGKKYIEHKTSWKPKVEKAQQYIEKNNVPFILGFRFLYGLRTVSAFAIATSNISAKRFMILNFFGTIIWAVAMASIGYLFGIAATNFMKATHQAQIQLMVVIAIIGVLFFAYRLVKLELIKLRSIRQLKLNKLYGKALNQ
jgi:membrane protein DedA with SNARE-associated domain